MIIGLVFGIAVGVIGTYALIGNAKNSALTKKINDMTIMAKADGGRMNKMGQMMKDAGMALENAGMKYKDDSLTMMGKDLQANGEKTQSNGQKMMSGDGGMMDEKTMK